MSDSEEEKEVELVHEAENEVMDNIEDDEDEYGEEDMIDAGN